MEIFMANEVDLELGAPLQHVKVCPAKLALKIGIHF